MRDATDALVLDLVEWIAREPRPYSEVIETWRTSCPRLTIWEDAVDRGYVARRPTAEGLRVAITGGTSGLGLALVRELHGRGARVAFVARTRDRVERVARDLAGVHGVVGDVSLKEDIHPVAVQVVGALGGLDVLVNNASDLGPSPLVP